MDISNLVRTENCLKTTELCSENVLNTADEKPNETLDHQNHKFDHKILETTRNTNLPTNGTETRKQK